MPEVAKTTPKSEIATLGVSASLGEHFLPPCPGAGEILAYVACHYLVAARAKLVVQLGGERVEVSDRGGHLEHE